MKSAKSSIRFNRILRLTVACEKPEPGDLLIDANDVYAVIENHAEFERSGRTQVAELVGKHGSKVTVMDPHRDVKHYWLKARGLAVCKRDDDE